jgi:hypothetical protein
LGLYASDHPDVLDKHDTIGQLQALGLCGFLTEDEQQLLVNTHEQMTRGRHLARIRRQTPDGPEKITPGDEQVAQIFERIFSASKQQTCGQ